MINLEYIEKTCITCGCTYYIPEIVYKQRCENKDWFYCFNGHAQHISESLSNRLQKQLDEKNKELNYAQSRIRELTTPKTKRRALRKAI